VSEPDPIGNEVRRVQRKRRIGRDAVCVLCGFADLAALMRVRRTLLEDHHVLGAAHAPAVTVALCRNCHAIESERLRDAGIPLGSDPQRSVVEVVEIVLRGLALFLRSLADALEQFADQLQVLVAGLDRHFPGWREIEKRRPD
jgi:hypothetical protein